MEKPSADCEHCGYQLDNFAEALEALEGGGNCMLCGGLIDRKSLEILVDSFSDEQVSEEGSQRFENEGELLDEEELLDGPQDFGDEGEDEEDRL